MQNDPILNKPGDCLCGCGGKTTRYRRNKQRNGYREIAGQYAPYIHGHNGNNKCKALDTPPKIEAGDCIRLNCALTPDGYSTFWIQGIQVYGHVYFWEKKYGPIPLGKVVDHLCLHRWCVNTDHHRLLTRHDNMMVGKFGEKFLTDRIYG